MSIKSLGLKDILYQKIIQYTYAVKKVSLFIAP